MKYKQQQPIILNDDKSDIREEIDEIKNDYQASFKRSAGKDAPATSRLEESEDIDGLIKWAKNLPDDIGIGSDSSFYLPKK